MGKSSLFNMLIRRRASIVEPTPGVTRDRVSAIYDVDDTFFELVDTGGFGMLDKDDLGEHVERQIRYAVEAASLILFVVDAREGLMPLDRDTANLLRRRTEIVRLVVAPAPERRHGVASHIASTARHENPQAGLLRAEPSNARAHR